MASNADNKDKIGLFGGTFDPIHVGHIIIAEWVLNKLCLDKIIFIPNKIHPFLKRKNIISAEKRVAMIRIVTDDFPAFELSTMEIDREGISYTVDTIREMSGKYPTAEIYYIMGEDNLEKFELWKDSASILELANVVTFRRQQKDDEKLSDGGLSKIMRLDSPLIDISSTDVRNLIVNRKNYQSVLYPGVYRYILENNLYR